MRKLITSLLAFSILLFSLAGCSVKPSFTDDNILPALKEILLNEFDIDALVKRNGNTLGICFTVPRLFTPSRKTMPVVIDLMQNVMLCLRRVLLSTNADIRFFQITIRGNDTSLEISMIRYVRDLKILLLSGISFGDYSKRLLYRNETNLASLGNKKLQTFFKELTEQRPEKVIAGNFKSGIKKSQIDNDFLTWLWESLMKLDINHEILETRMKCVDEKNFLFYLKVRETFKPKQGFNDFQFTSYSGQVREYIIGLTSPTYYNAMISSLLIKPESGFSEKINSLEKEYGPVATWPEEDFHAPDITLPQFLAEQIAGRIQNELNTSTADSEKTLSLPRVMNVSGAATDNGILNIMIIYREKGSNIKAADADLALKTAKEVIALYKFKDFTELKLESLEGALMTFNLQS